MNVPCKDCPDREVGCHSTCEKYKAFRAEKDREIEERKIQYQSKTLDSKYFRDLWKRKRAIERSRNPRR